MSKGTALFLCPGSGDIHAQWMAIFVELLVGRAGRTVALLISEGFIACSAGFSDKIASTRSPCAASVPEYLACTLSPFALQRKAG